MHALVIAYLYRHPMLLSSPLASLFGISLADAKPLPHESDIDALDQDLLLEEVFHTVLILPSHRHPPHDLNELPQGVALAPQEEIQEQVILPLLEEPSPFSALVDREQLFQEALLAELQEPTPSPLFQALEEKASQAVSLHFDDPLPSFELPFKEPLVTLPYEDQISLNNPPESASQESSNTPLSLVGETPLAAGTRSLRPAVKELAPLTLHEKKPTLLIPKTPSPSADTRLVQAPQTELPLHQYKLPELSPTALWNEDFSTDVRVMPNPEGKGYLFAVTLTPNKDLSHHSLQQNFYFLLDRSSSSQRRRFPVFKRAALKALSSLQPQDTFNIFILDKTLTPFRPNNQIASLKNRRAAEEFLETQETSFLPSNGNVFATLQELLPSIPHDGQMHTAILLTDGNSDLHARKKKELLNRWIEKSQGKVTLYTAAVGKDNDLLALDLISTESGGKLLYSDTHASFPRKLAKLILDLKDPLATELDVSVRPYCPQSLIELYPLAYSLPPLYAHEPYVILGEISHLTSFDLIIEGRHNGEWIGIKKTISLEKAPPAESQLVKQWKKMRAGTCYAKFLEEGKVAYLKAAKEMLNESQREIAFE
jgi:hypothetical protein